MPAATEAENERRVFDRFSARFPAKFKDSRNDYGTDVFLRDASASGARFVTKERFFLEDQVSLEVKLPDGGEPLVISGRVVWIKFVNASLWDIVVQFPDVKFMKVRRLFKFIEELSS